MKKITKVYDATIAVNIFSNNVSYVENLLGIRGGKSLAEQLQFMKIEAQKLENLGPLAKIWIEVQYDRGYNTLKIVDAPTEPDISLTGTTSEESAT